MKPIVLIAVRAMVLFFLAVMTVFLAGERSVWASIWPEEPGPTRVPPGWQFIRIWKKFTGMFDPRGPLVAAIKNGETIIVLFDATEGVFDDRGNWGNADPMGTLKGGEAYTVRYAPQMGWTVTGYNESTGGILTATYPCNGLSIDAYQLCLWGRWYSFNRRGDVFDIDYGFVGHMRVP